jgi:hypothetical protein
MERKLLSRRTNLMGIAGLLSGSALAAGRQAQKPQKDEGQPAMHRALDHLRQAKTNLENGAHDKGGHRSRALDLVNQAIAEVNEGIKYAIQH